MKKLRLISVVLAAAMVLTQFTVSVFAREYNYIDYEEEVIVNNGNFDEEVSVTATQRYYGVPAGGWAYSYNKYPGSSASVGRAVVNGENVLKVDGYNTNPALGYNIGTLAAGDYDLTFQIFPVGNVTKVRYRVFWLDSNFSISNAKYKMHDKTLDLTKGKWNTITYTISLTEEKPVAFNLYCFPDPPTGDGSYLIDNLSVSRAKPVALESADLEAINTASAVTEINSVSPAKGVWSLSNLDHITLDNSGSYVELKRNPADTTIPDTPTIIYTFKDKVDAGKYKLSFDVLTTLDGGVTRIAKVADGSWTEYSSTNSPNYKGAKETISGGYRYSYIFDVAEDDTQIGFRYYQNPNRYPSAPFSIDNVKLEVYDKTVVFLNEDYETYNRDAFLADRSVVSWQGVRGTLGKIGVNKDGNNEIDLLQLDTIEKDGNPNNTAIHYKAKKGTPAFAIGLGKLPRGQYSVSFDLYLKTGSQFFKKAHYWDATGMQNLTYTVENFSSFTTDSWNEDITFNFAVDNDNMNEYLVRFYPDPNSSTAGSDEFYVDNIKVTATDVYEMKTVATDDDINIQQGKGGYGTVATGYWRNKDDGKIDKVTFDGKECVQFYTEKADTFIRAFGNLEKGTYTLTFKYYIKDNTNPDPSSYFRTNFYVLNTGDNTEYCNNSLLRRYGVWNDAELTFTVDEADSVVLRFRPNSANNPPDYMYIDDLKLTGSILHEWRTVYENDFSNVPNINHNLGLSEKSASRYPDTWYSKYTGATSMKFGQSTEGHLDILPNDKAYYAGTAKMQDGKIVEDERYFAAYGFKNTLAKGDYAVEVTLKSDGFTSATFNYDDFYLLSIVDRDGNVLTSKSVRLSNGVSTPVTLGFSLESDADVVLKIKPDRTYSQYKHSFPCTIEGVTVYKLSSPVIGLTSNADLVTFDSEDGIYHMATNANAGTIYINYCNFEDLNKGTYKLSGEFMTEAEGATLEAKIGLTPAGSLELESGTWNSFESEVTLKYDTHLSISRGIKFEVNSGSPLYFKNLKLTFVEKLPEPKVSQGITMILLKKIKGEYPGFVSMRPVNLVVNPNFDDVPAIQKGNKYYFNQAVGTWSYAGGSGSYASEYITEGNNSFLRMNIENATVGVGYAAGVMKPGNYTLTFDILPEHDVGGFRVRFYHLESNLIASMGNAKEVKSFTNLKVGQWNTITFPFTVDKDVFVAFDFYGIKENPAPVNGSFCVDNVSIMERD